MLVKKVTASEVVNSMTIHSKKKDNVFERVKIRMKRIKRTMNKYAPWHWFDDLMEGVQIDLNELSSKK